MKFEPKVPTHARKRCPKIFFKETYDIGRSGDPKFKVPLRPLRARELQIQGLPEVFGREESLPSKIDEFVMAGR